MSKSVKLSLSVYIKEAFFKLVNKWIRLWHAQSIFTTPQNCNPATHDSDVCTKIYFIGKMLVFLCA